MEVNLLGKIKLYELAKELNLTSKELLKKAEEIGMKIKSHLSSLEDEEVEQLKKNASKIKESKKDDGKSGKQKVTQQNKNDGVAPVRS